jgi:hypothetical protein
VTQVNAEIGEDALDVGATAIPLNHPMNGSCMTEIVQPWLAARAAIAADTSDGSQTPESYLQGRFAHPFAVTKTEEWRLIAVGRMPAFMPATVAPKDTEEVTANGNEPSFEKLGLPDGDDRLVEIDVRTVESQGFADAKARSIERQQKGAHDILFYKGPRAAGLGSGIEKPLQFVPGVNIGDKLRTLGGRGRNGDANTRLPHDQIS